MQRLRRVTVWHTESDYYADCKRGKFFDDDDEPEIRVSESRAEHEGLIARLDHYRTDEWHILTSTKHETVYFEGRVEDWSKTKTVGGRDYRVLRCEPADLETHAIQSQNSHPQLTP